MSKDNGSPAFPMPMTMLNAEHVACDPEYGMSTRDWFAGMALQGHIANANILQSAVTIEQRELQFINAAAFAYRMADSMLAERNKR